MRDFVTAAEDPSSSQVGSTLLATVAVVDMVDYGAIAKILEENLGPQAVAKLNRQIRAFVNQSLHQLPSPRAHRIIAETGDGAIVFFHHAEDAHQFGRGVHLAAHAHNGRRSESKAERWFRIGIATGEINIISGDDGRPSEYAGMAIANAVRLEASARAGQIVVDTDTFAQLSVETQKFYGLEEVVRGKREETFRARRCCVTNAEKPPTRRTYTVTRRRAIQLSAAACSLAGTAVWLETQYKHSHQPAKSLLPPKRLVALMPWPVPSPDSAAVLEMLLTSIYTRVRRAERHTPNLVILDTSDQSDGTAADAQSQSDLAPQEMAAIWGATLILTVNIEKRLSDWLCQLKLLDSTQLQVLRQDNFALDFARLQTAWKAAALSSAKLLDLSDQSESFTDEDELAGAQTPAQQLLLEGRAFGKRLNDTGLDQAIKRYQDATRVSPEFALAYAELGRAFWRKFESTYDVEYVRSAEQNLLKAVGFNRNSVCAHLGQGEIFAGEGRVEDALHSIALILDKDGENTEALFLRGRIFEVIADYKKAQMSYQMLTEIRPQHWRAYNNLGYVQYQQGLIEDALASFNQAAERAPLVAIPIANRGVTYSGMEQRHQEALEDLNRSIELSPNETALSGLGDIAWEAKNYSAARDYFAKANSLEPLNHITWSDLGDTYKVLGQPRECQRCFAKAADLLVVHLTVNPKDGPAWMMLGLYHARLNKPEEAEKIFTKLKNLKPINTHRF